MAGGEDPDTERANTISDWITDKINLFTSGRFLDVFWLARLGFPKQDGGRNPWRIQIQSDAFFELFEPFQEIIFQAL